MLSRMIFQSFLRLKVVVMLRSDPECREGHIDLHLVRDWNVSHEYRYSCLLSILLGSSSDISLDLTIAKHPGDENHQTCRKHSKESTRMKLN
jgi:hypothetical protein